jgi:uncharacterized protein DUF4349
MTVKLRYLALLLLTAACTERAMRTVAREQRLAVPRAAAMAPEAPAAFAAVSGEGKDGYAASLSLPGATDVLPNLIIRSGTASLQVDSLEHAIALVRALARRVGGFVGSSTAQAGKGQLHSAMLEIRMPAEHFEDTVDGLRMIGRIETVNVTAEDVGEEYVDVQARMTNDRRLEARLIDLLAHRTGKLADVLDVERELARVREEIERYEGRLRYLRSRAAVSTLSLTVHEPIPVVDEGSPGVMGEAVRDAWRNFIAVLALLIQSLGVIIPLAICALAGWFVVRRWKGPDTKEA